MSSEDVLALLASLGAITLIAMVISVFSVAVSALTFFITRKDHIAVSVGTYLIPVLIVFGLLWWLFTMEVDDAPPGAVIIANLLVSALTIPIGRTASRIVLKRLGKVTR